MAFFPIKSGFGTRVAGGGFGSLQTGSFAALGADSVYASEITAIADGAGAGDIGQTSDLHDFDNGGSVVTLAGPTSGVPLQFHSVSDTNMDQDSSGAKIQTNSFIITTGIIAYSGYTHDTSIAVETGNNSAAIYDNSTFSLTTTTDVVRVDLDGSIFKLTNCIINCAEVSCGITISNGGIFEWVGGSLTASTHIDRLTVGNTGVNGGGSIFVQGVDLTPVEDYLLGSFGGNQSSDDAMNFRIDKCKLSGLLIDFVEETLTDPNQFVLITNSSSSSTVAEHQFYQENIFGTVEDNTATFRNESEPFTDSGQKVSFECITTARTSRLTPLTFDMPSRFAELSSASEDVLEIFLTSDTALTDNDVWVDLIYPDGTTKQLFNFLTTANANSLSTGTTLTTDATSTYTGGKANNYVISVDTSGDAGADSYPIIRINIGLASTTIYFDTEVGVA